jgi:hypothetical protein
VLQADGFAAALDPAFVVAFTDAGEAWFEQIVAGQCCKTFSQLALTLNDLTHRRGEIVVNAAAWNATQVCKGPYMAVEKSDGITTIIQSNKFAPRIHQSQQELPPLGPLAVELHGDLEKNKLRFIAHAVDQRHINFRPLAAPLAQVFVNHGQANALAFFPQRPMQPYSGQPLFGGRARFPFSQERFESWLHLRPHRAHTPAIRAAHRPGLLQILAYRVAA